MTAPAKKLAISKPVATMLPRRKPKRNMAQKPLWPTLSFKPRRKRMTEHIELLTARDYYQRKTSGFIVLVNGQPYFFRHMADIPAKYKQKAVNK